MKVFYFWALLLCTLPISGTQTTHAQTKPGAAAAKSFQDFYFNGQGTGVILADIKVCADVANTECTESVDPSLLLVGSTYKIWMSFVVPDGDTVDSVSILFMKDGASKFSRELSLKGAVRYRTWRSFTPDAPGIWEAKVLDNREIELEELARLSLVVSQ